MNKTVATVLLAGLTLGGGATFIGSRAEAQDASRPPPPGMMGERDGPMHEGGMRGGPGSPGSFMHRPGEMGWRHGMMRRMREFALIYPAADRNLSGPDVQKIAEAFLLFNGNHSWKVTEVTEEPSRVTFALATADGAAIAHFAMDRHTARPERLN